MNENLPATRRSTDVPIPMGGTIPAPYAPEGMPQDAFDLQHTFALLYRRRWILLSIFLLVVGASALFTWGTRPIYQATAQILIDTGKNATAEPSDLPVLSDMMGLTQSRSVETQAEIIKSPLIQRQAKKLEPAAAARLASDIAVEVSKNTDIVNISALSFDPRAAAAMANATCTAYTTRTRQDNRAQTRAAADYVAEQMRSVREQLDKAQTKLKQYKEEHVTIDLATESQQRVSELSMLESSLRQTNAERQSAVAELAALSKLSAADRSQPGAAIIASNPTLDAIKANLVKLELDRTALLQEYTSNSPEVRQIERQISDARAQLQQEATRAVAHDRAPIQTRVWSLQARGAALSHGVSTLRNELTRLPEQEYRLAQLSTDMAVLQQTYQMLNEKYQTLRISEEARQANAKVVSPAVVPKVPIRPRKAMNMALALILGLALAAGTAAVVDRLDNRVHTDEDAENATGVPVLAYIPMIRNEEDRYLTKGKSNTWSLLEGYRMLRTNLLFAAVDEPVRMIAVTSTEPGEGKTLSAVNLAVAMALDNKRVILVDTDLRHPTTHGYFDLSRNIGLTNVVAGEHSVEEALQETQIPGLRLLATGALPPNPPELLNSRAAHSCFRQLRDLADFVIIDTPPALVMADAHIVTNLADGVILVVSASDVVKQQTLARTADLLRQNGGRLLGTIMNKLQRNSSSYYGHYYAYSQDRYHKYYQQELPSGKETGA